METGHKSYALKELTSDGFGLLYAKRTQFQVAPGRGIEGLHTPEAGTQTSSADSGSGGPDWRGMERAGAETARRVSAR